MIITLHKNLMGYINLSSCDLIRMMNDHIDFLKIDKITKMKDKLSSINDKKDKI